MIMTQDERNAINEFMAKQQQWKDERTQAKREQSENVAAFVSEFFTAIEGE